MDHWMDHWLIWIQVLRYNTGRAIRPKNTSQSWLVQSKMQPAGLHETRLRWNHWFQSGFKVDSLNPKCNQQGCMNPDSDETSGFKVDSFNPKCNQLIGGVSCNQAGCIWSWGSQLLTPLVSCNQAGCIWSWTSQLLTQISVSQYWARWLLFFWLMVASWVEHELIIVQFACLQTFI